MRSFAKTFSPSCPACQDTIDKMELAHKALRPALPVDCHQLHHRPWLLVMVRQKLFGKHDRACGAAGDVIGCPVANARLLFPLPIMGSPNSSNQSHNNGIQ